MSYINTSFKFVQVAVFKNIQHKLLMFESNIYIAKRKQSNSQ